MSEKIKDATAVLSDLISKFLGSKFGKDAAFFLVVADLRTGDYDSTTSLDSRDVPSMLRHIADTVEKYDQDKMAEILHD